MSAAQKYGAAVVAAAITITTALVAKWEPARDPTVSYFDELGGIPTACYGHTRGVKLGMRYTMAQCEEWRQQDIADAMDTVADCIDYPLTSNQLGAIADGVVNLGPKLVCGSTLQRKANAGDMRGACAELDRWINAGGKPVRGLVLRREEERWICWPDFRDVISATSSRIRDGPMFASH